MAPAFRRVTPARLSIAATAGSVVCITAAVSATFGTFLIPISEEFQWSRAAVSGVLGLIALVAAVAFPFVGRLMDKVGARPMLIGGHIALSLLVMLLSRVSSNIWLFYLHFALIGVAGVVCHTAMFSKVVANWFDGNRGLMLGVTAGAGNGLGATLMPIVAGALLGPLGWRMTYVAIGALMLVIGLPLLLAWLHDAPRDKAEAAVEPIPEGVTLGEAARTGAFRLLLVAVAIGAGGMTAVFTHVVPMLLDRGVGIGEATGVVATFALVTAGWQIVTGALLDRTRTPLLIVPMYAAAIAGLLMLQFGGGGAVRAGAGVLLGIGMGAEYAALSYFASRYFGLQHYGAIIGALNGALILAQGVTPAMMDLSFDRTGSYDQAALAIAVALAIGLLLLFFLPKVAGEAAEPAVAGISPAAA